MIYVDQIFRFITAEEDVLVCHMAGSDTEELHSFAKSLQISQKKFKNGNTPHYLISPEEKTRAIESGALTVSSSDLEYFSNRKAFKGYTRKVSKKIYSYEL